MNIIKTAPNRPLKFNGSNAIVYCFSFFFLQELKRGPFSSLHYHYLIF